MNFEIGEKLRVDGDIYEVMGSITYRNQKDYSTWTEYKLYSHVYNQERWLSYDQEFREYSLSKAAPNASTFGYHEVDRGVQEVIGVQGSVDVEIGDTASFVEYEDVTEEKIVSHEVWDDGTEISTGYYLDFDEISRVGSGGAANSWQPSGGGYSGGSYSKSSNNVVQSKTVVVLVVLAFVVFLFAYIKGYMNSKTIASYLENSWAFTYETSITGSQDQKADVYKTNYTIDEAAKAIIDAIEGDTEDVQQNTEDGDLSIGILTSKEYCFIYTSEDGETLVQNSSRKYAYYSDKEPYRSNRHVRRYYRRYYYSRGYFTDMYDYKSSTSPYSSFDDSSLGSNTNDTYSQYSNSVRQASVTSRSSSGGGLSSGK